MTNIKELNFVPYNNEAWIIFVSSDKKNWWAERLVGFVQCEESEGAYHDKIIWWDAGYLEDNCIMRVGENRNCQIIFNRKPTQADANRVRERDVIETYCGSFEKKLEVLA